MKVRDKKALRARVPAKKASASAARVEADIECARKLVANVRLLGLHLVESQASLKTDHLQTQEQDVPTLFMHLWPADYRAQFSREHNVLYCGVRFRVTEDEQPEDPSEDAPAIVSVRAEYALFYEVPSGVECTDGGAEHFAGNNAVFNAWPFFRELAYSLVGRMGLPAIVTPLLRLPLKR